MKCTPLEASFGARLEIDLSSPIDGDRLRALFRQHELLLIRGREISDEEQIALLSELGRVEPEPSGRPMRMEVTNQHDDSTAPDGELIFHFDYAYDPNPISVISMYGRVVADGVTPTLFASSSKGLERLPEALLNRIRTRDASHACFLTRYGSDQKAIRPEPLIPRGQLGWGPDHYWAEHPVVWRNEAGVESLFVCIQHTDQILGLPRDESDDLLDELFAHLYDPEHIYSHSWEGGDLVIWDNVTVQHARPEPRPGARTLRRYHASAVDLTDDYVRKARELGIM